MRIDLLDRPRLELLNKRGLRYHLQDAEKDYFLAVIVNIFSKSKFRDTLIFKGGTAIYHCYLEQLRFSKDLDFTSTIKLLQEDVEELFFDSEMVAIKDIKMKKYGLDIIVKYRGSLGQPDTIGIDININQKVLMTPRILEYRNYYGINISCSVMDIKEIFAEKIRTLNDRARPRDLYDLVVLKKKFGINIKEAVDLLMQKEFYEILDKGRIEENTTISLNRWEQENKELYYQQPVAKDEIRNLTCQILETING